MVEEELDRARLPRLRVGEAPSARPTREHQRRHLLARRVYDASVGRTLLRRHGPRAARRSLAHRAALVSVVIDHLHAAPIARLQGLKDALRLELRGDLEIRAPAAPEGVPMPPLGPVDPVVPVYGL